MSAFQAGTVPVEPCIGLRRKEEARQSIGANKRPNAKVEWANLIGRVASHSDRNAFKILFEHFAPRIKGFMLKAGCSAEEAEDIAQNTFIVVWRKACQFDPETTGAAAWIFTIARNLRIDSVRRTTRRALLKADDELADAFDSVDSAEELVSRVEDVVRVKAAIEQLSAEQSKVIHLSFLEETAHPEIAKLLGIPLGTVKSRIRLAMNRLRNLLDEQP